MYDFCLAGFQLIRLAHVLHCHLYADVSGKWDAGPALLTRVELYPANVLAGPQHL
jgi:hypothetical protein